ncbi:hypothetical protein AVEN_128234-1 [Araneus ventricosus]|uniref:Uncharacterized protein n=1 Tax=Araneus ventricosus TaxID=182803 RepID=A0A4Y2A126_ARAVE|nr:hypothetical protein AVEN_128234-1 [Araneus ventricosus]
MLKDERLQIRELAERRIIKSRESFSNVKSVHVFLPPKLNFEAADYTEMIGWSSITITSPRILRYISTAVFSSIVRDKKNPEWHFVHFPCHTQAVERCVKLMTEASAKAYDIKKICSGLVRRRSRFGGTNRPCLDDDERIEHVLGQDKHVREEGEDEDEDKSHTKKVE